MNDGQPPFSAAEASQSTVNRFGSATSLPSKSVTVTESAVMRTASSCPSSIASLV